jgi:hypothetical protein
LLAEVLLGSARVRFTDRADGHLGLVPAGSSAADDVDAARRRIVDRPWSWLRQVHGSRVAVVDAPGGCAGEEGDALVTSCAGTALAVFTADCAPVALAGDNGDVAVVHAGWRGLATGVVSAAVHVLRRRGAGEISAALGPCIHAECYEFGADDLDAVADVLGEGVRAVTRWGTPALDLPAAARVALEAAGARLATDADACTACSERYFSHRARGDRGRQATVVWAP